VKREALADIGHCSASHDDRWHFESHKSNTTSVFAQLGRMRNGVFFDKDD
jgi:hypothetical protein